MGDAEDALGKILYSLLAFLPKIPWSDFYFTLFSSRNFVPSCWVSISIVYSRIYFQLAYIRDECVFLSLFFFFFFFFSIGVYSIGFLAGGRLFFSLFTFCP
ncbi:hypothetical protein FN846DRAFT_978302, partial [Sphaerosporella brunnea]